MGQKVKLHALVSCGVGVKSWAGKVGPFSVLSVEFPEH